MKPIKHLPLLIFLCVLFTKVEARFLLILGPSGVGKSTIIKHLKTLDARFKYISPYTTRALRPNECDKISTTKEHINKLQAANKLLTVNQIYGIYYATPKETIDQTLQTKNFPILDWPVDKLHIMQKHYKNCLYIVYIYPEDLADLKQQLSYDGRDQDGIRFNKGKEELFLFSSGKYDKFIHLKIKNIKGEPLRVANMIYNNFISNIDN